MLQLNNDRRLSYPAVFDTNPWYDDVAIIAPFWAYSDEYLMQSLADDFPKVTSKVYYHKYQASYRSNTKTRDVLARAKLDVEDSGLSISYNCTLETLT